MAHARNVQLLWIYDTLIILSSFCVPCVVLYVCTYLLILIYDYTRYWELPVGVYELNKQINKPS